MLNALEYSNCIVYFYDTIYSESTKKIIEDKKGTIKVISEEGKGATFIFTWPKETVDAINKAKM